MSTFLRHIFSQLIDCCLFEAGDLGLGDADFLGDLHLRSALVKPALNNA